MTQDWINSILQSVSPQFLEKISLQVGVDFSKYRELSKTIVNNRYGQTAIVEVQLLSKSEKEEYSIGFIVKKVFSKDNYFDYVVSSCENFDNLIEARQSIWNTEKKNLDLNEIQRLNLPDLIGTPRLQSKNKEQSIIYFDVLPRFVARPKSGVSPDHRYSLLGYALARMHGFKEIDQITADYSPWFDFLKKQGISEPTLSTWKKIIENSKGGVEYVFGDYTLDSVQYNSLIPGKGRIDSLSLIDPVLIPNADRCEDLGYLTFSLVEKYVKNALRKSDPNNSSTRQILKDMLKQLLGKSIPQVIQAYKLVHPNFNSFYSNDSVPIDFFAGAYLLSRSVSVTGNRLRDILGVMGTQLLEAHPISDMVLN